MNRLSIQFFLKAFSIILLFWYPYLSGSEIVPESIFAHDIPAVVNPAGGSDRPFTSPVPSNAFSRIIDVFK